MAIAAIRTVIIYIVIIAALRLAGKRQLGELQPAELVVTLLIADLAAVPMQDNGTPLFSGLVPIAVLVALELILSTLMMKCRRLSTLVSGNPVIVVRDGVLQQQELARLRLTVNDLLETLRGQQIFDLKDVQYAIVETNGSVSAFLTPAARNPTAQDLQLALPDNGAPVPVVTDGVVVPWAMAMCGVDERWVHRTLKKHKCKLPQVLIMTADKSKQVTIVKREDNA